MTLIQMIVIAAAGITGLTVFARAELLRPRVRSAYLTNVAVRLLMDATALACVFVIAEVLGGASLDAGFVGFIVLCAVTSSAVLISMWVHNTRATVDRRAEEATVETRRADVSDVRTVLAEDLPPALEAAMPQVIRDLAAQPDPYQPKSD